MKRAASLKIKSLISLILLLNLVGHPTAQGAIYSISQPYGGASYAPSLYGQTFLVPLGYSGTISRVRGLSYYGYAASVASVIWAKVWDSPSKGTLIATSSNTFTGPTNAGGWTTKADFELNFPTFNVIGGTTYYLEIGRSSGNGNFYISEASTNPYASGATYHDGVINTNYDIKFQLDITYSTDPVIPISPTISLSGVAQKGISTTITASTSVEGFLNFKVNKKSLPQCQKIRATGSPLTATCSWKPSVKGVALISVYLLPSDTATYQNSAPSAFSVLVSNRTNRR